MSTSVDNMTRPTADQHIGQLIKQLRRSYRLRQSDIAEMANHGGLDWTQSTVAILEAGKRQITFMEAIVIAAVITATTDRHHSVIDLLPADGWLDMPADGAHGNVKHLRQAALGEAIDGPLTDARYGFQVAVRFGRKRFDAKWPELTNDEFETAEQDAAEEAEQKAARKLDVHAYDIAIGARRLWGKSLTEERESVLATRESRPSPQARGHITRLLIDELTPSVLRAQERIEADSETNGGES